MLAKDDQLIRIFTGSEISVTLLKEELEIKGITALIQNNFQSGLSAGFFGGDALSVDLFIQESDLKVAGPIITDFSPEQ